MVPLRFQSPDWVRTSDEAPHRSTSFRHATIHERPGLWGDDLAHPASAVWLREGDGGGWEAFGAGRPAPAIGWLAARAGGRRIALLAPPSWEGPIRMMGGRVEAATIRTLLRPESDAPPAPSPRIRVRRLGPDDGPAFEGVAPAWALRSWADYPAMLRRGAAFGVGPPGGLASVAWTYESDLEHDKVGVATAPRLRGLGLGGAAASTLVGHVILERRKRPLWVTHPDNPASIALAISLGFAIRVDEPLLRWAPDDR